MDMRECVMREPELIRFAMERGSGNSLYIAMRILAKLVEETTC